MVSFFVFHDEHDAYSHYFDAVQRTESFYRRTDIGGSAGGEITRGRPRTDNTKNGWNANGSRSGAMENHDSQPS